jgi:ArsR family transcriptional regulator, arsenate/arsenite/antimonite-responsive transcriptional repressor
VLLSWAACRQSATAIKAGIAVSTALQNCTAEGPGAIGADVQGGETQLNEHQSTKIDKTGVAKPMSIASETLQSEQARAQLKALADPLRLRVIEALGGGERCVCDLTTDLGLAQSKLSFHLKVLKEAGLLADRQEGRWIYYRLRPEAIEQLRAWLAMLGAQCSKPATPCP